MTEQSPDYNDVKELEREEWLRRDSLCRAACSTTTVLLVIYGLKDIITGETRLAAITCLYASINLIALLLYERFRKLDLFSAYLTLAATTLLLYLVAAGGSEDSGIMWFAVYPILMFSILKVRTATIMSLLMCVMVALLLSIENPFYSANYAKHIKIAGFGTYLLITSFTFFQARAREISANSVALLNYELRHIASTDELTNLSNRRDMALRLEFECKRSKRTGKEFSVILCDIDYFKKINDSFGHSVGDQALKEFSKLLVSRFRQTDKVGRWGGEEFLVILPATPLNEAINIADQCRRKICQASLFPNMPNRLVTMSAGVASSTTSLDSAELLRAADQNLYDAKNNGRNRVKPDL